MSKILIRPSQLIIKQDFLNIFDDNISVEYDLFSDGSIKNQFFLKNILIDENTEVYIYHIFGYNTLHDDIMRLYFMICLLYGYTAKIKLILPYIPYSRKDRSDNSSEYIDREQFVSLIKMLSNAGASKIITCDLHNSLLGECCSIPILSIDRQTIFDKSIPRDGCIVAPDFGSAKESFKLSIQYGLEFAIMAKRRDCGGLLNTSFYFPCEGVSNIKEAIILDDIVDSGNTLYKSIQQIDKFGFDHISVFTTHAILSGGGKQKIIDMQKEFNVNFFSTDSYFIKDNPINNIVCIQSIIAKYIR